MPAALFSELARAKVNLSLHVNGRRPDGLHDLESLVTFADLGDQLTLDPGRSLALAVSGPAGQMAGPVEHNLVLRAAQALEARFGGLRAGAFDLVKQLPPAGGIGGGSADAAAALRLLAHLNGIAADDPRLFEAARAVGADVPVCLAAKSRMMRGTGENLGPPLALPAMHAALVNPGVSVATADVFAAHGLTPGSIVDHAPHPDIPASVSFAGLVELLGQCRNDLEPAAARLALSVGDVLDQLRRQHRCALARMSGSGATCFGLFPTMSAAFQAVRAIRSARPSWWVQPVVLGG